MADALQSRSAAAVNKLLPNSRRHQYIHHYSHTMGPQRAAADSYFIKFGRRVNTGTRTFTFAGRRCTRQPPAPATAESQTAHRISTQRPRGASDAPLQLPYAFRTVDIGPRDTTARAGKVLSDVSSTGVQHEYDRIKAEKQTQNALQEGRFHQTHDESLPASRSRWPKTRPLSGSITATSSSAQLARCAGRCWR